MTAAPASPSPSRVSTFLRRPELAVFLVALAVRFLALMRFQESPFFETQGGDSKFYHEWALRILHGQWTDHHAFYGLPGYAYLLAGLYGVFGVDPFVPAALQAVAEALNRDAANLGQARLAPPALEALRSPRGLMGKKE